MSGNFGKRLAGLDRAALAQGIRAWVPLVHAPPRSIWGVSGAVTLTIKPFTYLSEDDTAALIDEGARLFTFVATDAQSHDGRFDSAG